MDEQTYNIFEGMDDEFTPIITSNGNIYSVCEVLTQCSFKSHKERVYYANIGEIMPKTEEDGTQVYEFENVYHSKAIAAVALAQRMFYDFPQVLKLKPDGVDIIDSGLKTKLIRSEVWRAFEDWLGKFGENPFEVTALLNVLATNPSLTTIIQTMDHLQTPGSNSSNTTETPPDGSGDSSPEMESGRKSSS